MRNALAGPCAALVVAVAIIAPAAADQFKTVADNGAIEGYASAAEITRLSLVGDRVASVQKTDADETGNDFNIAHDAVTGDLYLSLPHLYDRPYLSFFVTTKRGYTYKAHLQVRETPATQIFISNPGVGSERAERWELETPFRRTVVRLVRAMWAGETVEGYEVAQGLDVSRKAGPLAWRVVARYDGAALIGRVLEVENRSGSTVDLSEDAFLTPGVIAVSLDAESLAPRQTARAFLILRKGAAR